MTDLVKRIAIGAASVAVIAGMPLAASAVNNDDVVRSPLYRDGSISCNGADDTTKRGGQVVVLPQPGKVQFKFKLRNAQPNTEYRLAVSREPNCSNPKFYPEVTTNSSGEADIYGTYNVPSGNRNLLFDAVATGSVNQARNREIGTENTHVVVP
jgi:hypothetical protein